MGKVRLDKLNNSIPTFYISENGNIYIEGTGLYHVDDVEYGSIIDILLNNNELYILSENKKGDGYTIYTYEVNIDRTPAKVYYNISTVFLPDLDNNIKYKLSINNGRLIYGPNMVIDTTRINLTPKNMIKLYDYDIVYISKPKVTTKYDNVSNKTFSIVSKESGEYYLQEL